jgi:hypothetical protein
VIREVDRGNPFRNLNPAKQVHICIGPAPQARGAKDIIMSSLPRPPQPPRTPRPPQGQPADRAETTWRNVFFAMSAAMAGFGLVDLDSARLAGALGSFGVAALMLSLMTEFPLVRLLSQESQRPRPPAEVARDAQRLREANPWAQRLRTFGWGALMLSIGLRLMGTG